MVRRGRRWLIRGMLGGLVGAVLVLAATPRPHPRALRWYLRAFQAHDSLQRALYGIEPWLPQGSVERAAVKVYGIRIYVAHSSFQIHSTTGRAVSPANIQPALEQLGWELFRYPPRCLQATTLRTIVLVGDLADAGGPLGGVTNKSTMLLEVNRQSLEHQRHNFHHEMFHVFDDGTVLPSDDARWQALERGGTCEQDLPWGHPPGSVNDYATTSVADDKAELFSYLMTSPELLTHLEVTDDILRDKANEMKRLVHDFCPELLATSR